MNNFMFNMNKLREGSRFTLDVWDKNNTQIPKYLLYIVDSPLKNILN